MKNLKKIALFALMTIALLFVAPFIVLAGGNPVDSLSLSTPAGYISDEAVTALTTALMVIVSFASGALPFLKKIPHTTVRSIASALLVLFGAGTFKFGFLNSDSIQFAVANLPATFGYGTFVYLGLQGFLFIAKKFGWVPEGVQFKSIKPATTKKSVKHVK